MSWKVKIITARDFCYWLQGHLELNPGKALDETQVEMIQKHLSMVFVHEIDPSFQNNEELNQIHNTVTPEIPAYKPKPPLYRPSLVYRC